MSALGTLKLYDHINWVVHDIIFTYDVNIEVTQVCFFFPSSTVHLVSCYDLFADLLIEFKCTLCIFECIYDSKDLSYVVTSFVLLYQDFPWENILALLFFLINLYCCTRIEACECWLTVMWIWRHFFFSLLHLKRKQNLWKNLLSLCTHIWIFFLHFLFYLWFSHNLVKKTVQTHFTTNSVSRNRPQTANWKHVNARQVELYQINCAAVGELSILQISVLLLCCWLLVRWKHILLGAICCEVGMNELRTRVFH